MRAPAGCTRACKQRRVQLVGDAKHPVDKPGIQIDVGADRFVAALLFVKNVRRKPFDCVEQAKFRLEFCATR